MLVSRPGVAWAGREEGKFETVIAARYRLLEVPSISAQEYNRLHRTKEHSCYA